MLIYKIHPAIGVARVGNHPSAFFIGPETTGHPGVEIAGDGSETKIVQHKDGGKIKRQAARFRIYEYDQDNAGALTLKREITAADAQIEWKVDLVNRKAALDRDLPQGIDPEIAPQPRNTDITGGARNGLIIQDPRDRKISGANQPAVAFDQGKFLGTTVYLGELRTDAKGRLVVLGGHGVSASVPPMEPLVSFANNDRWHDDVADGPVTATITFPGQAARTVESPAWVTVAPPDFAPGVGGVVTLYDVATQAAIDAGFVKPAAKPSFLQHIWPVIERASNLRFVHARFQIWNNLPRDRAALASTASDTQTKQLRQTVFDVIVTNIDNVLRDAIIPDFLAQYFAQYRDGDFTSDLDNPPPAASEPANLDRAVLEACVGLNFFPGIEASQNMRHEGNYAEFGRFNHQAAEVFPGFLTEVMAVPWQADFLDCNGEWWPSQRPDVVMTNPDQIPASKTPWAGTIGTHQGMVDLFGTRPFVAPAVSSTGEQVFVQE